MRFFLESSVLLVAMIAALLAPPVRAADLPCTGTGYTWTFTNGSAVFAAETRNNTCSDVMGALLERARGSYGDAFPIVPSTCSASTIVNGSTVTYVYSGSTSVTWDVAQLCAPSPRTLANSPTEALQMLLVLGGITVWGVGFIGGQQR